MSSPAAAPVDGRKGPGAGGADPAARDRATLAVLILATAAGLALRLYQLTRPGYLTGVTEYDDAVDFGSAIRLVHGVIPYRDFVLVQPPGIAVLMAPLAWLGNYLGIPTAFAAARVMTACASGATIALGGLLVRRRGLAATTLTCGLLAVHAGALDAAHTVMLEPWLLLFCLIGALLAFDGDELTGSPRRLLWAGVALGVAITIKVWAVLPALVLLALCGRRQARAGLRRLLAGIAAAVAVLVLPFVVLAPGAFVRDVVWAQLSRVDVTRIPLRPRIISLSGLGYVGRRGSALPVVLAVGAGVLGAIAWAGGWIRVRRPPAALDRFLLGTSVLLLVAFLWPADFYGHYAGFFVGFAAPAAGLCVGCLAPGTSRADAGGRRRGLRAHTPMVSLCLLSLIAVAALGRLDVRRLSRLHAGSPAAQADRQIPPGACVLTDLPPLTLVADRFPLGDAACPSPLDPIGTDYALGGGRNGVTGAGRVPAVARVWLAALRRARYVWISCAPVASRRCDPWTNRRIPWTPAMLAYLRAHFRPVPGSGRAPHVLAQVR